MEKPKRVWRKEGESEQNYLKRLGDAYQEVFGYNLLDGSLEKAFKEKEKEIIAKRRKK